MSDLQLLLYYEQKRVLDSVWHGLLQHLRQGDAQDIHLHMLRPLIL
jgi:hypothetical protein